MAEKAACKAWSASFSSLSIWRRTTGSVCKSWQGRPALPKARSTVCWPAWSGLGYVVQDDGKRPLPADLKMFELSSGIVDSMDIMGVAKGAFGALSQRTGEAVHLGHPRWAGHRLHL